MNRVSKSQNISDPTLNALLCILIKPQPGRRLGEKFKLGLVHIWHTWKIRLRNSSELANAFQSPRSPTSYTSAHDLKQIDEVKSISLI